MNSTETDVRGGRLPRVLILPGVYGIISQVWIHRHATGLKRYDCHVAATAHIHRDMFPHPKLHSIDSSNLISHRYFKFLHATRYFRWPTTSVLQKTRLTRILESVSPDIAHVHFLKTLPDIAEPLTNVDCPIVVTAHGTDVNRAFTDKAYLEEIRPGMELVTCFIAVSRFIREQLIELAVPPEKIVVMPLGVPLPASTNRLEKENPQEIRVLSVGSLLPVKGFGYLLEAFAKALDRTPHLRLTILGDGPLRSELMARVDELRIADKVHFKGAVPYEQVVEEMGRSDVYAQHSVRAEVLTKHGDLVRCEEALGLSMLEAAASGLPVVASASGGTSEAVVDGETGYLVPQTDVDMMAQKLARLAADEQMRADMGTAGRQFVARHYDITKQTAKLEDVYDRLRSAESAASSGDVVAGHESSIRETLAGHSV